MPSIRRILQTICVIVFLCGLLPPERMWLIGGGLVGLLVASVLPGLDD